MKAIFQGINIAICSIVISGCAYQAAYNPEYVPTESPNYFSDARIVLFMPVIEEQFVFNEKPSGHDGAVITLSIPLGYILKEVAHEVLADHFSGGVVFSNELLPGNDQVFHYYPSIKLIEYKFAPNLPLLYMTPQIEIDLQVKVMSPKGENIFDRIYLSGVISGEKFYWEGREIVNKAVHKTLYHLIKKSMKELQLRLPEAILTSP